MKPMTLGALVVAVLIFGAAIWGAAPTTVPTVAIEGYGARLVLHPPFTVNRLPAVGPQGRPDTLIHAHPDGGRIRNLTIVPSVPSGEPSIARRMTDPPGFEVVPGGTRVLLGADMSDLRGVADLDVGPTDPAWTIVSDHERIPWPAGTLLRSTESAPGFELVDRRAR